MRKRSEPWTPFPSHKVNSWYKFQKNRILEYCKIGLAIGLVKALTWETGPGLDSFLAKSRHKMGSISNRGAHHMLPETWETQTRWVGKHLIKPETRNQASGLALALLCLAGVALPVPSCPGSGFRVQGSGFRVQGSGFRVQGSGFRVQGSGTGKDLMACRRVGADSLMPPFFSHVRTNRRRKMSS